MNPDIFIDDFERTENTDELHAILGRALVVATRFDSMCKAAALHVGIHGAVLEGGGNASSVLLEQLAEKYKKKTLSSSIQALGLPGNASVLLTDANTARNAIAHDLAKGLTGCLDGKLDEGDFIKKVADLVFDIAHGDIAISHIVSMLNDEPVPSPEFIASYVERVIQWVVER